MNTVLKIFLSMSVSGSLLGLVLFLGTRLWKDKISRQWQYYIWLIVILRLLLPFGLEINLLGKTYQAVDQAITQSASMSLTQPAGYASNDTSASADNQRKNSDHNLSEKLTSTRSIRRIWGMLINQLPLIWLAFALGMLIRKITSYQSFIRYIHAGLMPVSDIEMLDQLSVIAEQTKMKKPIELCVNPLISSPLLIGFFHPCIVLPGVDIPEKNIPYIILHELTHYKRRDMFYKWLVQITLCLHWFNPIVYLMSREITKACEFSCDEAVLTKLGQENARDYGRTLLDAMAAVGKYKENLGAVTLSENKRLLKERLGAIMKFKRKSRAIRILTGALTVCMIVGAAFVGVYPVAAAEYRAGMLQEDVNKEPTRVQTERYNKDYDSQAERYYKAGSLVLFQIAFSRLDEETQDKWLDTIYVDNRITFWGTAVGLLDEDGALIQRYAEKSYEDGNIAYFSVLAMHMSEDMLERWLDKALEDGNWAFQSVLFNAVDRGDEFDELEEKLDREWTERQAAEYKAAGITLDGKNRYYQGKLINIFLDIRANQSFYTLDMNPAGTINIKITRDTDDRIAGVAYMTEAEVTELLEEPFGDSKNDLDSDD